MNNIILIGFKSSGKTTLGKKIAEKTGRHFIDTDDLIAKNNREFYLAVGPIAFREIEKEVIRALAEFQNCIIATGGGAILDPEHLEESFEKMYLDRKGIYEAVADSIVNPDNLSAFIYLSET